MKILYPSMLAKYLSKEFIFSFFVVFLVFFSLVLMINLIGELIYLRLLEISFNHLTGEIPETFELLKELEVLNLNSNEISGGFLPCFASWTKLQVLDVGNNTNFDPSMPNELSTLKDLKFLLENACPDTFLKF